MEKSYEDKFMDDFRIKREIKNRSVKQRPRRKGSAVSSSMEHQAVDEFDDGLSSVMEEESCSIQFTEEESWISKEVAALSLDESDGDSDDEEEEPPYYNSSDEEQAEHQSTQKEDATEDEIDDDEEEGDFDVYHGDGHVLSDDELLDQMNYDKRSREEKIKLLPKVRRYLHSITVSKGFECRHYPGSIFGFTQLFPRRHVIDERHRYPEGYNHLMYMANLALKEYNQILPDPTDYQVLEVKDVNIVPSTGWNYNLTFTAFWGGTCDTFRARVYDNVIVTKMEVTYCKIKKGSCSSVFSIERPKSYKTVGPDPVQAILDLHSLPRAKQFSLIKNDQLSDEENKTLFKKVRKYLKSVVASQGFKCRYFPGHLPCLPGLKPREKLIHEMNSYQECHAHLKLMAKLALDHFYHGNAHNYLVLGVQNVSMFKESDRSYLYYVTFIVWESSASFLAKDWTTSDDPNTRAGIRTKYIFEAKVRDIQHDIDVLFCREVRSY